jgi:RNA polymerase sigma-70 factor (ECF subfamily)
MCVTRTSRTSGAPDSLHKDDPHAAVDRSNRRCGSSCNNSTASVVLRLEGAGLEAEVALVERVHGLAAVATEHRAWLVRRLALVTGDAAEAEDLAQEALLRATERWPLPDGSDVRAWLAVVGVRLAIDERRRRRRWGFLPIRETDQEWAMATDPDLWRAMADLDRRTRAALVLTVLDGYTQDEVAEMLSVPRGTVASWLSRGKARLRSLLEGRGT